ncbi:MAG: hypothetical protein A3F72_13945 [Bacteroidetes bacterium RIFCSPLOWO2_12_FULL_35_15]|nr:MAG: hypothetical protein A3F72_13945 [Bacteroidetes bacterium RIFCSPLOWO2_12_FULL_35_15]
MTNRQIDKKIFTPELIEKAWEKGKIVSDFDPQMIRKDKCGALIKKDLYGVTKGSLSMAWEIDHIKPKSLGGTDDLTNLQPLQWENNKHKKDNYPSWSCLLSSMENRNQLIEIIIQNDLKARKELTEKQL